MYYKFQMKNTIYIGIVLATALQEIRCSASVQRIGESLPYASTLPISGVAACVDDASAGWRNGDPAALFCARKMPCIQRASKTVIQSSVLPLAAIATACVAAEYVVLHAAMSRVATFTAVFKSSMSLG